jgi:hypothetical protein
MTCAGVGRAIDTGAAIVSKTQTRVQNERVRVSPFSSVYQLRRAHLYDDGKAAWQA